jgi:hypothetical protein
MSSNAASTALGPCSMISDRSSSRNRSQDRSPPSFTIVCRVATQQSVKLVGKIAHEVDVRLPLTCGPMGALTGGVSASHVSRFHHMCSRPQTEQRAWPGMSGVLSRVTWSVSMPVKIESPVCGHLIMSALMRPSTRHLLYRRIRMQAPVPTSVCPAPNRCEKYFFNRLGACAAACLLRHRRRLAWLPKTPGAEGRAVIEAAGHQWRVDLRYFRQNSYRHSVRKQGPEATAQAPSRRYTHRAV